MSDLARSVAVPARRNLTGRLSGIVRPSRPIRFLATGLLNTAFGYAGFLLLLALGSSAGVALVLSTAAGVAFNYQTSRRIVFRSRRRGVLLRFVAVYLVLLALNWLTILTLRRAGLADWSAQGAVVLPLALLSYLAQRSFVFDSAEDAA